MLFFIPWVILILAVIIAVPVAAKMAPGSRPAPVAEAGEEEVLEMADDQSVEVAEDFAAEPVGEDAFAEFN